MPRDAQGKGGAHERLHDRGRGRPNLYLKRRQAAMSSPAPPPIEICLAAKRGELQKVVKWLRKGGLIDAVDTSPTDDGRPAIFPLLHTASSAGQLEMVRELLKRGASVDLPTSHGDTALMDAAVVGRLSIVLVLLQHSANPDLQSASGGTALMLAAHRGQETCVKALLRAKANTELLDKEGHTALRHAQGRGHIGIAELIRQHTAAASPAAPPSANEPIVSSPAPLPVEVHLAAERGEFEKVLKWLRKGGQADAAYSGTTIEGRASTFPLLHTATCSDHMEMVRELLKRGANVDLQTILGYTALMDAAFSGNISILLVLLQHSANPDLQDVQGYTALMQAAGKGYEVNVTALLRAKANTELRTEKGKTALQWAESQGQTATAELIRQHAASPQDAGAPLAAPPDHAKLLRDWQAVTDSLPVEINVAAQRGELQKIVKWLRKGGLPDAIYCGSTADGRPASFPLLNTASNFGHHEMVRVLLKRGASVDLPTSFGVTALMTSANAGHLSTASVLLQHSANPDLQDRHGMTALMMTSSNGKEACVKALLQAKANTELLEENGHTALALAENQDETAIATLIRQHVASLGAAVAPEVTQAAQAARADAAMDKLLAEEAAERAEVQARSKKSKEKKKAGRAVTTADDEPSEAPPAAVLAPPSAAAPKPESAAERAGAALRAAIASGGLSTLELALAAAPREVREGSVGMEARALCDRLLEEALQEAEREAMQNAAAEAAMLAAAERAQEVAVRDVVRVRTRAAALSKAREEAVAAAAAAAAAVAAAREAAAVAAAKAEALERAMAEDGEGGSSGAAGLSEMSEAAEVPDDYMCPITAEIMTDPVSTSDGFTYERAAISEWLHTKDTSPSTGAKLENKTVIPNVSLRSIIRSFVEDQAEAALRAAIAGGGLSRARGTRGLV